MVRNGKIARLPEATRNELNQRLCDGQDGPEILAWLNALPAAQKLIADKFDGVPFSANNLTEWRQGGYRDWLEIRQTSEIIGKIARRANAFESASFGGIKGFHQNLSTALALKLAGLSLALLPDDADPAEQWKCLRGIIKHAILLRRSDQRASQSRIRDEQWALEKEHQIERRSDTATIRSFSNMYLKMETAKLNKRKQEFQEEKQNLAEKLAQPL